ncbi:hypothetical protein EJ03DRAFT_370425 [Teratosphaeria nubilosa]|uniref:Uncharacterized protein n=1 Tax=Teratosphaeria nubilosa TaxID=161662 RepID=A0A6G1LN54_9PEZI|nr:hypothetical protein EJ03DRAFT_370425 [Teratosphaeria nubilosa]
MPPSLPPREGSQRLSRPRQLPPPAPHGPQPSTSSIHLPANNSAFVNPPPPPPSQGPQQLPRPGQQPPPPLAPHFPQPVRRRPASARPGEAERGFGPRSPSTPADLEGKPKPASGGHDVRPAQFSYPDEGNKSFTATSVPQFPGEDRRSRSARRVDLEVMGDDPMTR